MNHEKIDRMKQEYEQIEVPEALKTQVEAGIRKGKRETQKGSIPVFVYIFFCFFRDKYSTYDTLLFLAHIQ